ncbi:MAG: methyltransferase domain-containing protein [Verrucomicrobia bacterium]|nr:methyltransferase domain-containing protein [Verrucomicrobiota bacterium]
MGAQRKDWIDDFDDRFWLLSNDMPVEQAQFIKRALGMRKGQRVLDVPCGAGRTSLALAKLGIEVTGVELRSKFVSRAKRRFRQEGISGTFLTGDMRQLDLSEGFDGLVNWCGSFGYFDEATNLDVLRRFARAVRPGGRVLIDTRSREFTLRRFIAREAIPVTTAGGKRVGSFSRRHRWNPRLQRIESVWALRRGRREIVSPMHMRLYTPAQCRKLFERVGLAFEGIYGSWTGEAFSRTSRRLIVVGRKPK